MPKELLEIKTFNRGTISSPSENDIPPEAAAHSLNVDPNAVDGKLTGRQAEEIVAGGTAGSHFNSHYSCKIMNGTDTSKSDAILYDKDASKVRQVQDLDGSPTASDILTSHQMTGDSATLANTSNSHIRLGAGKGTESKWIGYVKHSQFGSSITGLQVEPSRLSNIDTFTSYDKIVALGSYVYGMNKGNTSIIKHSATSGEVVGQSDFPFVSIQCIALNIQDETIWVYDLDTVQHAHGVLYRLDLSLGLTKTILPTPVSGDGLGSQFKAMFASIPQMVRNSDLSATSGSYTTNVQRPGWYHRSDLASWDDFTLEKSEQIDSASYVSDLHVYTTPTGTYEIVTFSMYGEGEDYTKTKVDGSSGNFKRGYSKGLLFSAKLESSTSGSVDFYDVTPQSYQTVAHMFSNSNTKRLDGSTTSRRYDKYYIHNNSSSKYYRIYQGWFYPSSEKDHVVNYTAAGSNYKAVEHHADWHPSGGNLNGARQMQVMYYPSLMPLSNAYSGYLDVGTYSGNAGHNNQYKSLSWYATTVERTGELKYNDGPVNGSSAGTDIEGALMVSGRNWGGQAFMSWTTVSSGGNDRFRLTKVRYTLFDIPYIHMLNYKSSLFNTTGTPTSDNNSAIGSTQDTKGCLFNCGIGVTDLRVERLWDATNGYSGTTGKIHSIHVSSGPYIETSPYNSKMIKSANIWIRTDYSGTNKVRVMRFRIRSEVPYCGEDGNYQSTTGTQTTLSSSSANYVHFITNESNLHLDKWSSPIGAIAGEENDSTLGQLASTHTITPSLPSEHFSHLISGYPTTSGQTHHPYEGTAEMANAKGVEKDYYTNNGLDYYRSFAITGAEQKSFANMTTYHSTDSLTGNTQPATIKKLDDATFGVTQGAPTTLKACKVAISVSGLGSGSGFDTAKEYFYRISFLYDEYQESQMLNEVEDAISSGGNGFNITITILEAAATLPKRVSHVNLYRAEAPDHIINKPETLYRLVKKIPLDALWTGTTNKSIVVVDAIADRAGITFESNTGVSETLPHTSLDYGLSTLLNNTLFVSRASGTGLTSLEHYLFKSLPYKYDMFDWSQDFLEMPEMPVALASYGGRVLCFSSNNTYRVEPNNLYIEDTYDGIGCIGDRAHIATEYGLFFCDYNNIYQYTNSVKPIGFPILKNSYDESLGYLELIKTYKKPILAFDANNNALLVILTKADNTDTYIYVYTLATNRWDLWDYSGGISGVIHSSKGGVYSVTDLGFSALQKIASSTVARKAFTWISKIITGQHQSQQKKFYRIDVPYTGATPTVTYGFDGAAPTSTGTPDNDTGIASLKIKDTKRGVQIKISSSATTGSAAPNFVESIGIIMRRFLKLIKAQG